MTLGGCPPFDALVGLLGHELQHAVEIADAPEAIDEQTLIGLYQRIGIGGAIRNGIRSFDTAAALVAGQRVSREIPGGAVAAGQ